ncbi:MAG TPA: hypothetical protein VHD83_18650 [Puia sp.]|nr:hypothetical protein [Puia sp.]
MNPLIYIVFIAISFVASFTVYFQSGLHAFLRAFPVYLLCTLAVELIAYHLASTGRSPMKMYNYFAPLEFLFYMFLLRAVIQNRRVKLFIVITAGLYLVSVLINLFIIKEASPFSAVPYAFGSLLITIYCIYYFYELFQSSRAVNLMRQPIFWICAGLLFFYCCSFPIFGLVNYLSRTSPIIKKNISVILLLLNVFLYSSFTIAFLCRIRVRNST